MPSTGTPRSKSPGSTCGASSAYTDAGPPERTSASGRRAASAAGEAVCATSSEYTRHSRTRRAISCEYWPPRSTTRTGRSSGLGSVAGRGTTSPKLLCHSYSLGLLERLAFGLDRGREHDLGALELVDVLVAARRHRGAKGAHEVQRAVVLGGGPNEDLLQAGHLAHLDTRAARKRGVERGHAPVVTAARRFVGAGKGRADHDGVGAAGDRLGDVAAGSHPAVGDDVHVAPRIEKMLRARRGRVGDRRRLRNAYAEHASGRARGAGADA